MTDDGCIKTDDMGRRGGKTLDGQTIPDTCLLTAGRGGVRRDPRGAPGLLGVVIAILIPKSGKFDNEVSGVVLDAVQLIFHLKTLLAKYMVPKRICQVTELPRIAMSNVQKNILRDRFSVNA